MKSFLEHIKSRWNEDHNRLLDCPRIGARDLCPGDIVIDKDAERTVSTIEWMNGPPPVFYAGPHGTKVAIKVVFDDGTQKELYPSAAIHIRPRS